MENEKDIETVDASLRFQDSLPITSDELLDKLDNWEIEYKLYFISELDRFFKDPKFYKETKSLRIPDGSPIGIYDCDLNFLWK